MSAELPAVRRPDGRLYRPRKIVTCAWDDSDVSGADCGAVVLGTHDVGRARVQAEIACARWYGLEYAVRPEVGWYRLGYSSGRPAWVEDPVRGRAGVWFRASEEPEAGEDGEG